ncbi:MAG: hypothetical protein F6K48_25990 [Okeania sp. SIO3H1]|nr:hypothetical protein [Okeania sp. SIO3H1]
MPKILATVFQILKVFKCLTKQWLGSAKLLLFPIGIVKELWQAIAQLMT